MKNNRIHLTCGISLLSCLLGGVPTRAAMMVQNCDETSLRAAIEQGGTVTLGCNGVVALSSPLTITNEVVLDATNRSVVLSGQRLVRVFEVLPGASLTLMNLSIRDGVSTNGGAIYNRGHVVLLGCIIATNAAIGLEGASGIDGTNGGPSFTGSGVPNNGGPATPGSPGMDASGGAIVNAATLFATNTQFLGNVSRGGKGGAGGTGGAGQLKTSPRGPIESGLGGEGGKGATGGTGRGSVLFNLGTATFANCTAKGNTCAGGTGGTGGDEGRTPFGRPRQVAGLGGEGGQAVGTVWNSADATFTLTALAFNQVEGGGGGDGGSGGRGPLGEGYGGGRGGRGGDAKGGAVWSQGTCQVMNSTLAANLAAGGHGGSGGLAGGWACRTFAGDGGTALGGALFDLGSLSLVNGTIWNNLTRGGAATNKFGYAPTCLLRAGIPGAELGASIVTSNHPVVINTLVGGLASSSNWVGNVTDSGHNLCSDSSANFTSPSSRNNIDPLLGSLANHGGPTPTLSPLPGSPAIDTGDDSAAPATDQRGVPRPQGAYADIGAVEATFLSIEKLFNGRVRLRYAGVAGTAYTLETITAFGETWHEVETISAGTSGALQYADLPTSEACALFRVKSP